MRGLGAFLHKELTEVLRTWRIWVLPGMMIFLGLTSPIFAKITPLILKSVGAGDTGVVVTFTKPMTYVDSYAQWIKNLAQVVLFAVIIAGAGMVSAEKRASTAILVLTKPVSRGAFVVAKILSNLLLLAAATLAGMMICWGGTLVLFGAAPFGPLVTGTILWFVYAALIVCVMGLLSALIDGQGGAAGAGIAFYALASTLGIIPWVAAFSPASLVGAGAAVMMGKGGVPPAPLVIGLLLCVGVAGAAVWAFEEREL